VENYLLKLRYYPDMKSKNNTDFGYLKDKQQLKKFQASKSKQSSSFIQSSDMGSSSNDNQDSSQMSSNNTFKLKKNMSFGCGSRMGAIEEESNSSY
jgi:hypothetical protein